MSAGFPDDAFKELVRSRTDLVQLIGETIPLEARSGGREYAARCPWHDDTNPSLKVYPDRQTYRCWVCDERGDCFTFVQKTENVGFRDALRMLAERVHLEIPKQLNHRRGSDPKTRLSMFDAVRWASEQFHWFLLNARQAAPALDYLYDRGLTDETLQQFEIGFHPDDWQWLIDRARGRFDVEQLFACRLVGERRNGDGFCDYCVVASGVSWRDLPLHT